jgi:HAMP domain-containing protein
MTTKSTKEVERRAPRSEVIDAKVARGRDAAGNGPDAAPQRRAADGEVLLVSLEIERLVEAARAGKLSERGLEQNLTGLPRQMLLGINELLDAILLPIEESNRVLARIAGGKIDEQITQTYQGDHEKIKQTVNQVAVLLQNLQKK